MKNILFPTDFSACADNAFDYALHVGVAHNAALTVMHAQQVPILDGQVDVTVPDRLEDLDREVERMLSLYRDRAEAFGRSKSMQLHISTRSEIGFVTEQILSAANPADFDMIAMGTKGATGLAGALMGSITSTIIAKAHVPVLVIPDGAKYSGIQVLIYASDFEEMDRLWMKDLLEFAKPFNAVVTCVHLKMDESQREEVKFEDLRDRFKTELVTHDIRFDMIPGSDVEHALVDYADNKKADLIAMLSHRRNFIDRLFHRSHTRQMTLHSHLPLLIFPER
jgi:nucleotide-binding universal stress UspA family protein